VADALARQLRLQPGQSTTADGEFTLGKVACVGCCTLAPVVRIGDARPTATSASTASPGCWRLPAGAAPRSAATAAPAAAARSDTPEVLISLDSCCVAAGSDAVHEALAIALQESRADATLRRVGCVGTCHQVPMVEVRLPGLPPVRYVKVQPSRCRPSSTATSRRRACWRVCGARQPCSTGC